ncbi:MAG: glycosyltransferase [Chloroflexi bacterium]|nr:glycosyltransferase [Chloroflexota bacterium]
MLIAALVLLSLLFLAIIIRDLQSANRVPLLAPERLQPEHTPSLMVIIPARNEAGRIERCLEGLAAQQLPHLDILVLDDNSTDNTAEVVRSFGAQLPGLRVIAGAALPQGWAGKCWACWQAAQASDAEWLLFLDADTAPLPGMIATLFDYAHSRHLDLLTLLPLLELGSWWERVLMPPFIGLIQAVYPIDRVNDPRSSLALANGQCILVRCSAYFAVDGHRAVRDSVLEDVRLAQTIKGAGYRMEAVGGPELMRVRMYTRFSEVAEGLRKNAMAGYRAGGTLRSGIGGARQALLAFGPLTLIAAGLLLAVLGRPESGALLICGLGLLILTLSYWGYVVRRLHGLSPIWALLYPFGTLCYFLLAGQAFLSILRGQGVTWKGRSYSG